jgi:hypothetical protein
MSKVNYPIKFLRNKILFLVDLFKNLSNLIFNNDYTQISLMLNRRTLNNDEILNKLLEEYDLKIPGLLKKSFRSFSS